MKQIWEIFKKKEIGKLLPLLLIGVLLLLLAGALGKRPATVSEEISLNAAYSRELEERVADLCREVDGVGNCTVMVTLKGKVKRTYSGDHLVYEEPPEVIGVTVVCDGGGRASVKRDLTALLTALFDIGSNRIAILRAE